MSGSAPQAKQPLSRAMSTWRWALVGLGYACEGGFVLEKSLHSFSVDETAEGLMQRMLTPR